MSDAASGRSLAPAPAPRLHPRPFKLRFAARQARGRSHIQPARPLKLPDIVTGKFYSRWEQPGAGSGAGAGVAGAGLGVAGAGSGAGSGIYGSTPYRLGPRELAASPQLSSHEYGWYVDVWAGERAARRRDPRLTHALRDPAWLRLQARLLRP